MTQAMLDINLRHLTHRYFEKTGAKRAARRIDRLSDRALGRLLRSHWVDEPSEAEITRRDEIDDLLSYYAILEVASIAKCVPDPLPADLIEVARIRLGRPSVRRYFSALYPLALPQFFVKRLDGQALPSDGSYPLFASFLDVSQARKTVEIDTFLWFLDDGQENGTGLEDVLRVIRTPERLVRSITAQRSTPLKRGLRGLLGFLRFARELDELLLRSAGHPILQSAFWHYHGYWFQLLGLQLVGVLAATIESYREQVGNATSAAEGRLIERTHADMDAAQRSLQRLCSGTYSAALDARLYEVPVTIVPDERREALPVGSPFPSPMASPITPPSRRALCVGIDDYATAPLAGCVDEARSVQRALASHGFETVLLLDRQATRAAMLAALQQLISWAVPGDTIVFQYAGHSTRFEALGYESVNNGGEGEVLCPADMDTGAFITPGDIQSVMSTARPGVSVTWLINPTEPQATTSPLELMAMWPQSVARVPRRFLLPTQAMIEAHLRFRAAKRGDELRTPSGISLKMPTRSV